MTVTASIPGRGPESRHGTAPHDLTLSRMSYRGPIRAHTSDISVLTQLNVSISRYNRLLTGPAAAYPRLSPITDRPFGSRGLSHWLYTFIHTGRTILLSLLVLGSRCQLYLQCVTWRIVRFYVVLNTTCQDNYCIVAHKYIRVQLVMYLLLHLTLFWFSLFFTWWC